MQMKSWVPAMALCAAAATGTGRAAVTEDTFLVRTTGDLAELCSAAQSDPMFTAAINFCHGFAVGVFRVLDEQEMARRSRRMFCLPTPAPTRTEGIAGFVQWAKANPGQTAQPPADGVARYLAQQFPCPHGR